MAEVRQAHLPGNYELYDVDLTAPGAPICKFCWEKEGVKKSSPLETVWLVKEGKRFVWWLCEGHRQEAGRDLNLRVLMAESSVVRYPRLEGAGS